MLPLVTRGMCLDASVYLCKFVSSSMTEDSTPERPDDDAGSASRPRPARTSFNQSQDQGEEVRTSPERSQSEERSRSEAGLRGERRPVRSLELIGIALIVLLCDLTVYHGRGYGGLGALFASLPILMWVSSPYRSRSRFVVATAVMLFGLAAKLLYCGTVGLVQYGVFLVFAFALSVTGQTPYVLESCFFGLQSLQSGYTALDRYCRSLTRLSPHITRTAWLTYAMPVAAVVLFGAIFILANPDLATLFGDQLAETLEALREWLDSFSPEWAQLLFWLAVAWIAAGLLRPVSRVITFDDDQAGYAETKQPPAEAPLYPAWRNTLLAVSVLFAVYLIFEFQTLWFREFPQGFYYSGYAHEGAAWLTLALALATILLSLVFRGGLLNDPRIDTMRRLAWVWSMENFVLALAVYNRLFIYIGFNGMTRMRIVGLYGMTAVVIGFVLVVWKITFARRFRWLLRRQMWTLALIVYAFVLTPLDAIVVPYNVRRILADDPAPSVQINVHPISAEGVLFLLPLLDSEDMIIREGVAAMLAEWTERAEREAARRLADGWTATQLAEDRVLEELRDNRDRWARYEDPQLRRAQLARFYSFAYQWY